MAVPRFKFEGQGAAALNEYSRRMTEYLESVERELRGLRPQPGSNTRVKHDATGVVIEGTGDDAASTESCPFAGGVQTLEGGSTVFQFSKPGTMYPGGMPTNMFDGSANLLSLGFSGDGPHYIKGVALTDGTNITSWDIQLSTTPAEPMAAAESQAPSGFELDLWVVFKGRAKRVIECGNLTATVIEVLDVDVAAPACGESPRKTWYRWDVTSTAP